MAADRAPVPGIDPDVLYKQFHAHLDTCAQCAEHPFALCQEGHALLMAWGKADQRANLKAMGAGAAPEEDFE